MTSNLEAAKLALPHSSWSREQVRAYAQRAIAALEAQLVTAKSDKRIQTLHLRITAWEKLLA